MSKSISRRNFLKMAAITGTGAALAACGTPATTAPAATSAPQIVEVTKIVEGTPKTVIITATPEPTKVPVEAPKMEGELRVLVGAGAPVEPTNELMGAAFTAKYPGMKIKWEYTQANFEEQVYTSASAGTLADVFLCADLWVVPFAKHDVTLDLKPYAEADPDVKLDDIFPSMLGLSTYDNKVIMFPSGLDVVTMYYNKTLLEKAGATVPTDTWTWDDLVANSKKVTALEKDAQGNPKYWGFDNATWNWWATVYPWIVGYGGDIVNKDGTQSTWSDAKTLDGLKAYTDMWVKDNVGQPLGLDVGGSAFDLGRAAFYFHIQGTRQTHRDAIGDKFEWDVQLMPKMPNGKHLTGMGTWGMSVYGKGKNTDAAYQYVKGMITAPIQLLGAKKMLTVPLLKSVTQDVSWMDGVPTPPKNLTAFVKGADDAILPYMNYPGACGSFYAGIVSKAYQDALEAVLRKKKTAEEAFPDADKTIQSCLTENAK